MTLGLTSRRPLTNALGLLVLAFLYGCQAGEQEEASSAETDEAQGELGSEVEEIMNSSLYRYGEWGYLEVDPSKVSHNYGAN